MDNVTSTLPVYAFKKILFFIFLLNGILYSNLTHAICNYELIQSESSCTGYNSTLLNNTKNSEIALLNKQSQCIFEQHCLTHQLCYDDEDGSKKSCDKDFISDITYQCKVNFGRLIIVKEVTKRSPTCLKSIKKTCKNLTRGCGETCLIYGPDKIEVKESIKIIKRPHKFDYGLPGAIFYPTSRYQSCLDVTQGYKAAVLKMKY